MLGITAGSSLSLTTGLSIEGLSMRLLGDGDFIGWSSESSTLMSGLTFSVAASLVGEAVLTLSIAFLAGRPLFFGMVGGAVVVVSIIKAA